MATYTELKNAIFHAHEKPDDLAKILKSVLTLTPEVYATEPTFAVTTPATGGKIENSGTNFTVNVPNATSSVVLTATNKSGQTFTAGGTDAAKVTAGGSGTALTLTVATTTIATTGGELNFTVKVTETNKNPVTLTFKVIVAPAA